MKISREKLFEALKGGGIKSGNRGWWLVDCPFCGKEKHCGVIFGKKRTSFVCFKCGEKGTIFTFLKKIGRLDLFQRNKNVDIFDSLQNVFEQKESHVYDYSMPNKSKPIGYKRIKDDSYLRSRGWEDYQFEKYNVGITDIDSSLRNYLIFLLIEDSECKGYLSRSKYSKKWHDKNQRLFKKGKAHLKLRYKNSSDTDFGKTFFGCDELESGDKTTAIIVEGIFKKTNVENLLSIEGTNTVALASFGKKLSDYQIMRLIDSGIKKVILLYDPDAIDQSKKFGIELDKFFDTWVGYCDIAPDDMNQQQLFNTLNKIEKPNNFSFSKIISKLI